MYWSAIDSSLAGAGAGAAALAAGAAALAAGAAALAAGAGAVSSSSEDPHAKANNPTRAIKVSNPTNCICILGRPYESFFIGHLLGETNLISALNSNFQQEEIAAGNFYLVHANIAGNSEH